MGLLLSEPNAILAGFAAAQVAQSKAVLRAEYVALLDSFDWQFEFSDDGAVYRRGREQLSRIRALQPHVDPDGALFSAARPDTHGSVTL